MKLMISLFSLVALAGCVELPQEAAQQQAATVECAPFQTYPNAVMPMVQDWGVVPAPYANATSSFVIFPTSSGMYLAVLADWDSGTIPWAAKLQPQQVTAAFSVLWTKGQVDGTRKPPKGPPPVGTEASFALRAASIAATTFRE